MVLTCIFLMTTEVEYPFSAHVAFHVIFAEMPFQVLCPFFSVCAFVVELKDAERICGF